MINSTKLKMLSAFAMIVEMFKHQQKTLVGIGGHINYFPYHSHKSKTFKKNQRVERKLSAKRRRP